jgi:hypothetical protein
MQGNNGVIIKLKVAIGRYAEINKQGDPLQRHGSGMGMALWRLHPQPVAIGVREEHCIANSSRIEIIGLVRGHSSQAAKAPCHYGHFCTLRDRGCKFDHGRGGGKTANAAMAATCRKIKSAGKERAHLPNA